jgi:hypothetical protein
MNSTAATNGADATNQEQIQLRVSGFRSFSDLNIVRKAISRLPGVSNVGVSNVGVSNAGVSNVQARPMGTGVMVLLVSYAGMVPFQVHLDELTRSRGRALPAHLEVTA